MSKRIIHQPKYYNNIRNEYINNNESNDIDENCSICGIYMTKIEEILVDPNNDNYICVHCKYRYDLNLIKCRDLLE